MQVNVAQLLKSPIGAERSYPVDELVEINDDDIRVRGDIKLIRTDRGILASANLKTEIEVECSRCLEPFLYPANVRFEEEYFPTIDVISGLSIEIPEEQAVAFTIDKRHIIDMDEAIREYAILDVPMKPLCREDCAGLCPGCGQNLNTGKCVCREDLDR